MPRYFFHFADQIPVHDRLGEECAKYNEAKDHGSFIANRIETEEPGMVSEGNFSSVTGKKGREVSSLAGFDGGLTT